MAYSPLFGCHGGLTEYVQTAKLSTYGLSTDQIADGRCIIKGGINRQLSVSQLLIVSFKEVKLLSLR